MSSKNIHTYIRSFFAGILQAFRKVKVGKPALRIDKNINFGILDSTIPMNFRVVVWLSEMKVYQDVAGQTLRRLKTYGSGYIEVVGGLAL